MTTHIFALPVSIKGNPYLEYLYAAVNETGGYEPHPFSFGGVFSALMSGKKTIVHMHWESNVFGSKYAVVSVLRMAYRFPLLFVARAMGAKMIWTMHNLGNHDAEHPALDRFGVKIIWRLAQGVIVQNKVIAAKMQALHPWVKVAYVPIATFKLYGEVAPQLRAAERQKLGVGDSELLLLSLGLIRHYKQPEVLIDAVHHVKGVHLLIAGKGDLEYIASLKKYAAGAPVTVRGEFIPDAEIPGLMAATDYALFSYGGSSMTSAAVMLAFAYGVPAIMFKMELSTDELLRPGAGWAVETDDELKNLFEKLPMLPKPSASQVEASIADLTWERVGREVRALYESV